MKLVAAKCPSCGADIEVDKNSDKTKCEFCNTKIIVDEAIQKYKVEVSGNIEVDNLPKLENYLKLGERYYIDLDYKESFKNYSKALELDPDNFLVVLRYGITKSLLSLSNGFDIKSLQNGLKNALKLLDENDYTKNICISEANDALIEIVNKLMDSYKNNNLMTNNMISELNRKLIDCVYAFDSLIPHIIDNDFLKKNIYNNLIYTIDCILMAKKYKNPNQQQFAMFILDNKTSKELNIMKKDRIYKRNMLDPEFVKQQEEYKKWIEDQQKYARERKKEIENKAKEVLYKFQTIDILCYVAIGLFAIMALGCFLCKYIFTGLCLIPTIIIYIPYLKNLLVSKNGDMYYVTLIARIILPIFSFFSLVVYIPEPFEGEWVSDNKTRMIIKDDNITIEYKDNKKFTGTYTSENIESYIDPIDHYYVINLYDNDGNYLLSDNELNKISLKYIYFKDDTRSFCVLDGDKVKECFKPVEDNTYEYIMDNNVMK